MMPLLTDSAAARARDAVIAIDAAIRDDESGNDGYAALFSAYVATLVPDGDAQQERMLDRLVERLGQPYARAGLFGGLAGDGWVLCHIGDECEPLLVQIDRQLHAVLPTLADFDLISGSAGIAIYFAERLHQGAEARDALATTFAHLASGWRAAPGDDCGLAHGTPGVIAAVTVAASRGIVDAVALRDEALAWLSRARLADGAYPTKLGGRPARTAWCYGDPGIVAGLWNAG
ncbi:MAG TPA: lanthionine synthetase LanC family protein, partial [Kofleriaceae bacterium]|nr:lanthionine synthetase LanC family protein [Kofleriaceae bacterium]